MLCRKLTALFCRLPLPVLWSIGQRLLTLETWCGCGYDQGVGVCVGFFKGHHHFFFFPLGGKKKNSKTSTGFQGSTRRKPLSALKKFFFMTGGYHKKLWYSTGFRTLSRGKPNSRVSSPFILFLRKIKRKTFSKKKKNPLRGKVISPQCPGWHHPRSCFSVAALINLPLKNSSFFLPFFSLLP